MDVRRLAVSAEAAVSYCCAACEVNWWPHQVDHGRCPMCGGDSIPTEERGSDDADLLHRIARAEAEMRDVYANFDRYYAGLDERDRQAA
jgi:hypothetical protein